MFSLVGALIIVPGDPLIKIFMQLLHTGIALPSERHPVELVENCLLESFADAVGLRPPGSGLGLLDLPILQADLVGISEMIGKTPKRGGLSRKWDTQIMDPSRTERNPYTCDYQFIKKGDRIEERRILLKEKGRRI